MILTPLAGRSLLSVSGSDSFRFLQGLVSNDMSLLNGKAKQLLKSVFLGSDGRVQGDALISSTEGGYMIETGSDNLECLLSLLQRRKLGSSVENNVIDDVYVYGKVPLWLIDKLKVGATPGKTATKNQTYATEYACETPFLSRVYSREAFDVADFSAAYRLYMALNGFGLALAKQLKPLKVVPQDMRLHSMGFISQNKGCYVGQEVMNRIINRTLSHKYRLKYVIRCDHTEAPPSDRNFDDEPSYPEIGLTKTLMQNVGDKTVNAIINGLIRPGVEEIPSVTADDGVVPIVYYSTGFGLALCPQRGTTKEHIIVNGERHTPFTV
ncbi:hypothetical protein BgAZ_304740 [Babesia gibsoni]|uniref:Uncharacterized protein n=1 Tax=Babesia gibsoni TaxID=33632 RepID=A0AAD8LPP9_BABGI|nr:hypothetical protein BgAZ_304740 [Babesia gibsoni]